MRLLRHCERIAGVLASDDQTNLREPDAQKLPLVGPSQHITLVGHRTATVTRSPETMRLPITDPDLGPGHA